MISLMNKKLNKKGFTLAELLIVVAIIAVLAAIAIPVFGAQLNKAKHNADVANVRAVYAEVLSTAMINDTDASGKVTVDMSKLNTVKLTKDTTVACKNATSITVTTPGVTATVIKIDADVSFTDVSGDTVTYKADAAGVAAKQ